VSVGWICGRLATDDKNALPPLLLFLFPTGTEVFPLPTNEEIVTWARELLRIDRDNAP
jgi:hypothetical protein